jgi:hypothetical protein
MRGGRASRAGLSRGLYGLSVLQRPLLVVARSPTRGQTSENATAQFHVAKFDRQRAPIPCRAEATLVCASGTGSCRQNCGAGIPVTVYKSHPGLCIAHFARTSLEPPV